MRKARWNDGVMEKDKIYTTNNEDNTSSTENSSSHCTDGVSDDDVVTRKATIVIEHRIQALSDTFRVVVR